MCKISSVVRVRLILRRYQLARTTVLVEEEYKLTLSRLFLLDRGLIPAPG